MSRKILAATTALAVTLAATLVSADARGMGEGMRAQGFGMDFATMDVNGDGSITADDIEALRVQRFAEIDADGNGQVSRDEFMNHASAQAGERAGAMFDRMDADGDGTLSRDALEARRGPGPDADRLIRRFDGDGDGAVSEEEFESARASLRERMMNRPGGRDDMRRGGGWRSHN